MTEVRKTSTGKGRAAPAPVQDRPAPPQRPRGPVRAAREQPTDRLFTVVGPKRVGGAHKGQDVVLTVTDAQARHLIEAGHVVPATERPPVAEAKEGGT